MTSSQKNKPFCFQAAVFYLFIFLIYSVVVAMHFIVCFSWGFLISCQFSSKVIAKQSSWVHSWVRRLVFDTIAVCCPGEAIPAHQCRPPAAGLLQSLSAAGEGGPCQRARTHQPAGGWQAESAAHHQEWVRSRCDLHTSSFWRSTGAA